MQFKPVCRESSLKIGSGGAIVATGWTHPERLIKLLPVDSYAAIGSLYSAPRGINFLLRNLIANPQVKHLVAIAGTKEDGLSRSVDYLENLFQVGFKLENDNFENPGMYFGESIDSSRRLLIDANLPPREVVEAILRTRFHRFDNLDEAVSFVKENGHELYDLRELKLTPGKTFKFDQPCTNLSPSPFNGIIIRQDTLIETWLHLIKIVSRGGAVRSTRHGGSVSELLNVISVIDAQKAIAQLKYTDFHHPALPFSAQYLQTYLAYALQSNQGQDNQTYTYGDRIHQYFGVNQLNACIEKLNQNQANTAIINLWDSIKDHGSLEPPCLNHLRFSINNQKLFLTATFRSHDVYGAWYLNAASLLYLQDFVAMILDQPVQLGDLTIISQSAHIYEYALVDCFKLLKDKENKIAPRNQYDDPCGNFILEVRDGNLVVEREYHGQTLSVYRGTSPVTLYRDILGDAPNLEQEHCFYLGTELQKMAIALQLNIEYIQDRSLRLNKKLRSNSRSS